MHTHIGVFGLSPRHVSGPGFLMVRSLPSVPSRSEDRFLSLFLGTWFPQTPLFSASLSPKTVCTTRPVTVWHLLSSHTALCTSAHAWRPSLAPDPSSLENPTRCASRMQVLLPCPLVCKRPWGKPFVAVTSLSPAPPLSGGFKLAAGWPCPLCPVPVTERACCMRCPYS